jgi:NADH-quinone oxidoreductase subunit N
MTTPDISWIAIAPELVLALGAAVVLLVEVQWKPGSKVMGWIAASTLFLAMAFTSLQWALYESAVQAVPPSNADLFVFSGMITMDGFGIFSRLALLTAAALGIAGGWGFIKSQGRRGAEALALILLATAGFSIMVASNNLIMMFLGLEIGSISLYVISGFARENKESDEASLKYFLLGSFASAIFVYGVALVYAGTRQFGILGIEEFLSGFIVTSPAIIYIGIGLLIVGLGFKVSAAPFHTWAPDVYQGAPAGIVGYMAAVAKIAGFAAMARILLTAFGEFEVTWVPVVAAISAVSMVLGAVAALVQSDVRRVLAYSGVAHAGFIMTGVVGDSTEAILFYLTVYSVKLIGAFLVVAVVSGADSAGSAINSYRGLSRRSPGLAAAFAVLLLGMAGLPLTSGFIAKFGVFSSAWANGYEWLVIVAVVTSVITFAFYLRVIVVMYMNESDDAAPVITTTARWVLGLAVVATILAGVLPEPLLEFVAHALPL